MEIYNQLYDLIDEIKKEDIYQRYVKANEQLQKKENKQLLKKNKEIHEKYFELRKYEEHIDVTEIKNQLKEIKSQMANNTDIQEYYRSYRILNERLYEISEIMFAGISNDLSFDQFLI